MHNPDGTMQSIGIPDFGSGSDNLQMLLIPLGLM
jgi:hypothetical protein